MKISTKGRYGLRIMLDLADHVDGKPRVMREIAESQNISEKYISRLVILLRQAGLVESVRGIQGGLRLTRFPEYITVLEVLEIMEGPINIVDCVQTPNVCEHQNRCSTRLIWERVNQQIRTVLAEYTLKDIKEQQKQGSALVELNC